MQGLVNMMDGVEQNKPKSIFSCVILAECGHALSWRVRGVFLEDFHEHVTAFASRNLHWVSDCGFTTENR